MSSIAELIDPKVAKKVKKAATLVAPVKADEPAFIVRKKATDPNPPKRHAEICKCQGCKDGTTVAMTSEAYRATYYPHHLKPTGRPRQLRLYEAIVIDPRSAAVILANCVDCGVGINVDPTEFDPEFFEDEDALFFPMCTPHATIREQYKALDKQREAMSAKREKEQDMDVDNMADAELGAMVKADLKAEKTEKIKAAKPKVEAERRKADKLAKKGTKAKQAERKVKLPGFTVDKSCEVPDLDLSDVPSLDECPSAAERRPYNQARFRLLGEPSLIPPSVGEENAATYRTLLSEHERLSVVAVQVAKERTKKAKKAAKAKAKKTTLVAKVSKKDSARVQALAVTLNCSEKKAAKILASMS